MAHSPAVLIPATHQGVWGPLAAVQVEEVMPWHGAAIPWGWDERAEISRERIARTAHMFDGPTVAVSHLEMHGGGQLSLTWWEERFADLLVRFERAGSHRGPAPGPGPETTAGLGLLVHLHCREGWIRARRSEILSAGGTWVAAAAEGVEPDDLRGDGQLDIAAVARRALGEELGIEPVRAQPWVWQQLWNYGWQTRLYALAWTELSLAEIEECWRLAEGGWESSALALGLGDADLERDEWLPGLLRPGHM